MTGALVLLACFCYEPFDIGQVYPPPPADWRTEDGRLVGRYQAYSERVRVAANASADIDPVLAEVRALSVKVDRLEMKGDARDAKLDAVRDEVIGLKAAVMGKNQLIDEDHVTINAPTTGLAPRMVAAESSLDRHSRLIWALAEKGAWLLGCGLLAILGVILTPWKRLWPNGKSGKGGKGE